MTGNFLPRGLVTALQFLTRLPTLTLKNFTPEDQAASVAWYPIVGAIIGVIVAAAMWAGSYTSPWFGALLAVMAWVWITGALHLDGLADVADGLGAAHRDPERFLEVVKDPHVGSFGAIALVLLIAAKLVLLADITALTHPATLFWSIVLIPAWTRWGPLVWRNLVPPLGDGRGKAFADRKAQSSDKDWRWVAIHGILLAAASLWIAPALLAAVPIALALALWWHWRLGGMTGDCHGASIEVMEALLLAALVVHGG